MQKGARQVAQRDSSVARERCRRHCLILLIATTSSGTVRLFIRIRVSGTLIWIESEKGSEEKEKNQTLYGIIKLKHRGNNIEVISNHKGKYEWRN